MKKVTLVLPDELDAELRERVETEYAGVKGGLSIIVIQALREWFKNHPSAWLLTSRVCSISSSSLTGNNQMELG